MTCASRPLVDTDFGVVRDPDSKAETGMDSTEAFQCALDACYAANVPLIMTQGAAFISGTLINRGVPMYGEGKPTASRLKPMPTMAPDADFIRFDPDGTRGQDYMSFEKFMIQPKIESGKYGRRALYISCGALTNVGQFAIKRMYFGEGNDYSISAQNTIAVNPQGNPSNAVIEQSSIFEGIKLAGVGDNVSIRDNFIISGVGSGRVGIYAYLTDGSGGVASFLDIERNAMNADNSAIVVDRGRNVKIHRNNIEDSHGVCTNGSVIVMRGSGGTLSMPSIKDNAIGVFGDSTANVGVNLQATYFAQVRENNIITDVSRLHAVAVGSGSTNARIFDNKVGPQWVNAVIDSGVGTLSGGFVRSGL